MTSVANRKFDMPICTSCNNKIDFINYLSADRDKKGSCKRLEITHHKPDLKMDPVRYHVADFKKRTKDDKDSKFILSLSFPLYTDNEESSSKSSKKKKLTCSTLSVVLDKDIGPETDEDCNNLRRLFSVLHIPLFNMSKTQFKNEQFRDMSAAEYMDYAAFKDPSLILRLLYAFATGNIELDIEMVKKSNEYRSQFMAVAVAKELLQNITLGRPGPFPLMMAHYLESEGVKDGIREYFSQIRLAASATHVRNLSATKILDFEERYAAPDPLTAFSLHFDNLGFRGRTNKWSQHTIVQLKIISIEQLKKAGFYNGGRLSRERKSFRQIASDKAGIDMRDIQEGAEGMTDELEMLAKGIIAPTREDISLFSERVLASIQCAIGLDLPSYEQCEEFDEYDEIVWDKKIPLNLSNKIKSPSDWRRDKEPNKENNNCASQEVVDDSKGMAQEAGEKLYKRQQTLYERNNIVLDRPLHEDPNRKETVRKIMRYLEESSEWDEDAVDYDLSGGEPPVRDMIAPATSDGSPLIRFIDIMDEDKREHGDEDGGKFKKAQIFLGGMHYLMEVASMSNRLSRDILTYFAHQWRPTEPQLNWLLGVSDPTDYVLEMPQFLLAHYRAAADALHELDPDTTINAIDVHKHMLRRARKHPACMAILLNIRFIEIALMIRDSEKSGDLGDVDLFLTTIRLALPILAASHAVNYVHICCEFLERWETASDADKVFFREFLFTQKSPLGKPVWADRAVEWTMRHTRMFLGRYARTNQKERLEKTIAELPFRIGAKRDLRALSWRESNLDMYSSVAFNLQYVKPNKAFVKTYLAASRANLWGDGELDGDFHRSKSSSNEPFLFPIEDEGLQPMSSSYLSAYEQGESRAKEYYIKWHIKNRHAKSRDGVDTDLKVIPSQSSIRREALKKMRIVRTSTSFKELDSLPDKDFTKDDILRDLKHFRESHYHQIPSFTSNDKKEILLRELCKWRHQYFIDFPEVKALYNEQLEDASIEDGYTDRKSRKMQLKHFIFSLDKDVVDNFE